MSALVRILSVLDPNRECALRVDFTRSPNRPARTASCAKRPLQIATVRVAIGGERSFHGWWKLTPPTIEQQRTNGIREAEDA